MMIIMNHENNIDNGSNSNNTKYKIRFYDIQNTNQSKTHGVSFFYRDRQVDYVTKEQ